MKTTQPRKQRKRLFQASSHKRYRHFSAPLSSSLKASHKTNSIPVRVGDAVRVMRGDRKGFEGKVTRVDRKEYRLFVEGLTREKVDGSTIQIPLHPSKVMITSLNLDDKWRREALKRFAPAIEEEKIAEEKPVEEEKREEIPKEKPKTKRKAKKTRKKTVKTGGEQSG